jgi:hypothetical protein
MSNRTFYGLLVALVAGVILSFVVPVLMHEEPIQIRPEPIEWRDPAIRATDRSMTYNPMEDM